MYYKFLKLPFHCVQVNERRVDIIMLGDDFVGPHDEINTDDMRLESMEYEYSEYNVYSIVDTK